MRDGPVPRRALPRWFLTIMRKLNLNSPLSKRLVAYCPSSTAPSPLSRIELAKFTPAAVIAHIESLGADESWAAYRLLTPQIQELVATHVNTNRWSELLVREMRDQAVECVKRERAVASEATS